MADTTWAEALARLRPHLAGQREGNRQVGSLNWLQERVRAHGGNPASVRNIIYRDVGQARDKQVLRDVLTDLARGAALDLSLPTLPAHEAHRDAERFLDREKRRVARRFLADLRHGRTPRVLIAAKPGAGKTILIDHLSRAVPHAVRLRLDHDFAPELTRLAETLGVPAPQVAAPLARLDAAAPYGVSGMLQHEVTRALVTALRRTAPTALLVRVAASGHLAGHDLRLPDGSRATPAAWVWHHLLEPLAGDAIATLCALSDVTGLPDTPSRPVPVLPAPTLEDTRRFVRAKLPDLPPAEVERIVRHAGRDYDALGLLTLLAAVGQAGQPDEPLPPVRDPALRTFLEVIHVACPPEFPDVREDLLERLLPDGRGRLTERRDLELAFLEQAAPGRVRLTNTDLVTRLVRQGEPGLDTRLREVHRHAAHLAHEGGDRARALHHALRGHDWDLVLQVAQGPQLDTAWRALSTQDAPDPARVATLARRVVEYFAALGRYFHPTMLSALAALEASTDPRHRTWATVKHAEGLIDAARFDEARQHLQGLGTEPDEPTGLDVPTRVELALGSAAFARWEGRARSASHHVEHAATLLEDEMGVLGAKVRLWRGMIAKDLGDWPVALGALQAIAEDGTALQLQRDRANYQLGDLWMRLGQQPHARRHLDAAIAGLATHGAPPEEESRARARLGTVLRRLGLLDEAHAAFTRAAECAPDDFTTARAQSEAVLLHAARGQYDLALRLGDWAWRRFREAESRRPLEARYRRHRVTYRVALAYVCRGVGRPYLPPLAGATDDNADLAHARDLLGGILGARRAEGAEGAERDLALDIDVHLALALATPDVDVAVEHARTAVTHATHPYHQFQARTYLAEALLRAGRHDDALTEVNLAHAHARATARLAREAALHDPAFTAWLLALEAAALAPRDPRAARDILAHALADEDLRPFRASVALEALRVFGDGDAAPLVTPDPCILRPADALRNHHA